MLSIIPTFRIGVGLLVSKLMRAESLKPRFGYFTLIIGGLNEDSATDHIEGRTRVTIKNIDVNELPDFGDQDPSFVLIDVREHDEFFEVSSPHAKNYPLSQMVVKDVLKDLQLSEAETEVPLYFICQAGVRSLAAAQKFLEAGYKNIYNVEGGMLRWQELGLPTQKNKSVE